MEDRVQELEIRCTLQQDLLHQLSDIIARHDQEIAHLRSQLDELRQPRASEPLPFSNDEKPPHY